MASARCMCGWPVNCGGSGVMHCIGCGGDLCVCRCGGEGDCPGCEYCDPRDDDDDDCGDDYGAM